MKFSRNLSRDGDASARQREDNNVSTIAVMQQPRGELPAGVLAVEKHGNP
jgi:hypothetical protein